MPVLIVKGSVDYWTTYVTNRLKHMVVGNALDRGNNVVKDQRMIDALIEGGK